MKQSQIQIEPCQPFLGAEISGVDLRQPIIEEVADDIRAALLRYQVIVFRDQDINRDQHRALAQIFAEDRNAPFSIQVNQATPVPGYPEILRMATDGTKKIAVDVWHTDESFRVAPPTVSVLRGLTVPSLGGDTVFSSGVAAYEYLPHEVKAKIRDLKALHGAEFIFRYTYGNATPDKVEKQKKDFPPLEQPVVRVHPETKLPVLYVNQGYTGPIVGMDEGEGNALLALLFDQIKRPDYQMRVRWRPNSIVIWDNRSVQHYAVGDYTEPRIVERIVVAGAEPAKGFSDVAAIFCDQHSQITALEPARPEG